MLYQARPPCPALAPFVELLWYCEMPDVGHARELVLPDGRVQILVDLAHERLPDGDNELANVTLTGVRTGSMVIDTRSFAGLLGVLFRPGGAAPFVAAPLAETNEADWSLADFWGHRAADLRERLLEAPDIEARFRATERALLERAPAPEHDWAIDRAVRALAAPSAGRPVAETAEALGLSRRRFADRFERRVGLTPKRFARLERFRHALRLASGDAQVRWSDVAQACGYFDQAHFAHEFRRFSGVSPSEYQARRGSWESHLRVD